MNLSFSNQFPWGADTYFIDSIWKGLLHYNIATADDWSEYMSRHLKKFGNTWNRSVDLQPKIHTIRRDRKERWRSDAKIHPIINPRSRLRYQFAPVIMCVNFQWINIKYYTYRDSEALIEIHIDGVLYGRSPITRVNDHKGFTTLAHNDGFLSAAQMFRWFSTDYTGKIIHWTPFTY